MESNKARDTSDKNIHAMCLLQKTVLDATMGLFYEPYRIIFFVNLHSFVPI